MTTKEHERVKWHLRIPVCETLGGCRIHLELCPLQDLALLCQYLQCNVEEIEDRFWQAVKGARGTL